jgi:hypothetical protein
MNENVKQRSVVTYTPIEEKTLQFKKMRAISDLGLFQLSENSIIHPNQEKIANEICEAFANRAIINVMLIAKTQSGKTGSMCSIIQKYLESPEKCDVPFENIFILTGMSSCEWKEQTKERVPECISKRIFHRCDLLTSFVNELKNKKNVLIIMDEIQVAAKKGQTIYKSFHKAGLLNKQNLLENDIKIVEYTATPDGTIYDLMKWKDASLKLQAEPGHGYTSASNLVLQKRVRQYKELCGYDKKTNSVDPQVWTNIREIKYDIDNHFDTPKYHIIRTNLGTKQTKTIQNLKEIFSSRNFIYIKHDQNTSSTNKIEDINLILRKKPTKHTFILIKESLRCAKSLFKEHLGILYERHCGNPDDSSIIQGLIGRSTGYDDNGVSICYTNLESIDKYERMWNSNFDDVNIHWNSKTTEFSNGKLKGKNTFNDPKIYVGFSSNKENDPPDINEDVPIIKEFLTQEEVKTYYNATFTKGRGPNKITINENGYYEATIRSKKRPYTYAEILLQKKHGLTHENYRIYPCYENLKDKNTLKWIFLHY